MPIKDNAELIKKLSQINTAQDFERIFRQEYISFFGSRRRCAEMLANLAPLPKREIAQRALKNLERQLPFQAWNYAGD